VDGAMNENFPIWTPPAEVIERANVTAVAKQLGLPDYKALHAWSAANREQFWGLVKRRLGIQFRKPFDRVLRMEGPNQPVWFPGAEMNIVDSCFQAASDAVAVVESDGGEFRWYTCGGLRQLAARVANALGDARGQTIGVIMPLSFKAVAIYLGVIASGAAAVSIADSFSPDEIATRLRIAGAKRVFTQANIAWGPKKLPLYEKIVASGAEKIVVIGEAALRAGDVSLEVFVSDDDQLRPVRRSPQDAINILFSSGTTGEPKAIPWDHTTPLKCAADAHFHHDLHSGDVTCWPTNLGWMMGPWLIFASLINRCTMALYTQAPTDAGFGRFVQDAKVNMLGLVPSLVRSWRQSKCMEGLDWSAIRCFSSTGECSNPSDMAYLMQLPGSVRPIIEYCGGTEIGGGYVTSTVVQPNAPSMFTTPAMGLDFVLIDDDGKPADKGEVFIDGPSIGLSTRLLNRDHDAVYYKDTPTGRSGSPLRRHGDELYRTPEGGYRVAGRSDDTMNLGGIKVGCAEIERVLNVVDGVHETAAVAMSPDDGGPSRLVIFLVARVDKDVAEWKKMFQQAIRSQLNPLFHVDEVRLIAGMPRTASNKVMRRELRKL
jgi:acetyl-CoA synthetase